MKILRSIPGTRYQVSFCPSWRKMRTDEYRRKTIHHVYDADDDDDDDGDDGDDDDVNDGDDDDDVGTLTNFPKI